MRFFILLAIFAFIACGQKNNTVTTSSVQNDSTKKTPSATNPPDTDKIKKTGDSLPPETAPSDEALVNTLLNARPGYKWHVVKDKEAKWEKNDFDYYLTKGRKKDPNYPFIIKGDFNGDNKMDFAALVTTGELSYGELITKIAILPADGTIIFLDENSFSHTVLTTIPKLSTIVGNNQEDNAKKIKIKYDAIEVNNHDGGGYYIYWNGSAFNFLYSEG